MTSDPPPCRKPRTGVRASAVLALATHTPRASRASCLPRLARLPLPAPTPRGHWLAPFRPIACCRQPPGGLASALDAVSSGPCPRARVPSCIYMLTLAAAYAFTAVLVAAGSGSASVRDALETAINGDAAVAAQPIVSKVVAKRFVAAATCSSGGGDGADATANPLHALRRAQVSAQGGEAWVADGVCASLMGERLLGAGAPDTPRAADGMREGLCEAYGASLIAWVCTHAEALAESVDVSVAIDYALEMRRGQDSAFSLAGRTPKTVRAALDAYALTTVRFDNDERFEPNPHGVNGLFLTSQRLPKGTVVRVPYDEPLNGGPGSYELGEGSSEGRGSRPCTIRVAEIGSLRRLILEGRKLNNCARARDQRTGPNAHWPQRTLAPTHTGPNALAKGAPARPAPGRAVVCNPRRAVPCMCQAWSLGMTRRSSTFFARASARRRTGRSR